MPKLIDVITKNEISNENPPLFSFEYFPPKTEAGIAALYKRVWRMQKQGPLFCDITWGAGGSTSDLTMELASQFTKLLGVKVNMHLTCTNINAETVAQALDDAKAHNIDNILALRGDPPSGQEKWEAVEGGFECALDLIKSIKEKHADHFGISCAGYPEGHPNAIKKVEDISKLTHSEVGRMVMYEGEAWVCHDADYESEMDYLKKKVDAGAQFIVTQLFYDADTFLAFVKRCRAMGITVPILPGIMPIANQGGFYRMCGFCKTRLPEALVSTLKDLDEKKFLEEGHKWVTEMCKKLWASGEVPALHFYTLNNEKPVYAIMRELGIKVASPDKDFPEEKEEAYKKIDEFLASKKIASAEPPQKKAKADA